MRSLRLVSSRYMTVGTRQLFLMANMNWCLRITLLSCVILEGVLGNLQNLTFYGAYVVFKPSTKYFKFDLNEQMDVLLLEHRTNTMNTKLKDIDYLYRIHLILNDNKTVNCTILRKKEIKIQSQYKFWNLSEKMNMAISWGSVPRNIEIFTQLDGNHNSILSWRDRSKTRSLVRYVGLAVAPTSVENNNFNESDYPHANWKIREEQPVDVDIRDAFQICDIRFLSSSSSNKSELYKISVTREQDEDFLVTLEKRTEEVLRTKTTRMDPEKIAFSWDAKENIISFGQMNEISPLFLWKDTDATRGEFNRFEQINFNYYTRKTNREVWYKITGGEKTIAELYPKFFTHQTAMTTTTATTMKSSNSTMGETSSLSYTTTQRQVEPNSNENQNYIPDDDSHS